MRVNQPRPALFELFPRLASGIPWLPLGWFPTPLQRVAGLCPDSVELWVKREDQSGVVYGGNKVRKLEFVLADALARGAKRVVTVGGIGSHHVLCTAIYGRQLGLGVEAVVFPQPLNDHVREQILADLSVGAELRPTAGMVGVPWALWRARRAPHTYYIPGGGSSLAGTLGYLSCGLELSREVPFDVTYGALGSCGMMAGLWAASCVAPGVGDVVGVRVVDRIICNRGRTKALANKMLGALRLRTRHQPRLTVEHGYFGGAYGRTTPAAEAAVADAAKVGLHLEPTYTGKAMAALLAHARAGKLDGKRVLFMQSYSSADLGPILRTAPAPDSLPPLLRRCFASSPVLELAA